MVWPAVVLALGTLAGVVTLAAMHSDTSVFLTALAAVVVPVLGALGYGQITTVKEQTNGALSQLLAMLQESHRMLAAAHVPASALPRQPDNGQAGPDAPAPAEAAAGAALPGS